MPISPDLVVYSRNNEPCLLVEVKAKEGASEEWARQVRRNLLLHGGFPRAPYFMLVTSERLYLWSDEPGNPEASPTLAVSTTETLKPLLDRWSSEKVDELSLELVTQAWLSTIAHASVSSEEIAKHHRWMIDTGLFESIKGGHVELEPVG